jgi:hypothetical protein
MGTARGSIRMRASSTTTTSTRIYLLLKNDEPALLDYLATLVAKEYVVYNNPRAAVGDLGEEMVRMLVRVRRHLPGKV